MEVATRQYYIEDLPTHGLSTAAYLAAAQQAAASLRWTIVAMDNTTISCHTALHDVYTDEFITITTDGKTARLHCTPANEYYNNAAPGHNATLYKQALAQVLAAQEQADRNLHPMHREKYGALLPSKSYIVTPVIVYANVLVFLAMVVAGLSPLSPTAQSLFEWGGNLRPAVMHGQWWRLVTYIFLHGGFMHLLMNTFALLYIGMFLEPLLGRFRFATAYIFSGVCAGLMSITMHHYSVGVGASGAIFGMYGVFLSMLTTRHITRTLRKTMLRSILFFILLNLLYGLEGNTDNAAHIGGLLSGIAIGYAYYYTISHRSPLRAQVFTAVGIAAAIVSMVAWVVW